MKRESEIEKKGISWQTFFPRMNRSMAGCEE